MNLLEQKRAEGALATPPPTLTTTRLERAMAAYKNKDWHIPRKGGRKHGGCPNGVGTPLYHVWSSMRRRVLNSERPDYPQYGGRGIRICDEWSDYARFREWALGSGYSKGLSLDRKDNDGGYCPENCRWASPKTQARNRSSNRLLTFRGKTACLAEHAEAAGLRPLTVQQRLNQLGWTVEKALSTPTMKRGRACK